MIIVREAAQEKAALKRGWSNRDIFGVNDPVRIKDHSTVVEGEDRW